MNWGANAAVLFGRQLTHAQHQESGQFNSGGVNYSSQYQHPIAGHDTNQDCRRTKCRRIYRCLLPPPILQSELRLLRGFLLWRDRWRYRCGEKGECRFLRSLCHDQHRARWVSTNSLDAICRGKRPMIKKKGAQDTGDGGPMLCLLVNFLIARHSGFNIDVLGVGGFSSATV